MTPALAEKSATMCFEVPHKVDSLHSFDLRGETQRLTNHRAVSQLFFSEGTIGLDDEGRRFTQVGADFVQRLALCIRTGKLLQKADVAALGDFLEYSGKFELHLILHVA